MKLAALLLLALATQRAAGAAALRANRWLPPTRPLLDVTLRAARAVSLHPLLPTRRRAAMQLGTAPAASRAATRSRRSRPFTVPWGLRASSRCGGPKAGRVCACAHLGGGAQRRGAKRYAQVGLDRQVPTCRSGGWAQRREALRHLSPAAPIAPPARPPLKLCLLSLDHAARQVSRPGARLEEVWAHHKGPAVLLPAAGLPRRPEGEAGAPPTEQRAICTPAGVAK